MIPPSLPACAGRTSYNPMQVLYVVVLYLAIQTAEGYLLTPVIEQRAVSLPPALTIIAQVLLGVLVGGLGVVLAVPLMAAAGVLVKMLYIEDTLGDGGAVPGTDGMEQSDDERLVGSQA
jgi:predicted PurR-regulated permease PerM